ncbi:MAG: hypothetical protein E7583_10505 [Ruminococcaceae bacterium]|nr:hypothetical protein [Oscillospiraceae bacterium]
MNNKIIKDVTEAAKIKAEIDIKAEELKNEILTSKSDYSEAYGNIYYVSENGDDNNEGLSPETPLKTLEKASSLDLLPGDAVLFKRGETFRGTLKGKQGVIYSAYGEGKKPVITNSLRNYADPDIWEETEVKNVYKLTIPLTNDVGVIVFNEGEAWSEKRIKGRPEFPQGGLENLDVDLSMWHDIPKPLEETGYVYLRCDKGNPGRIYDSIEIATRKNIASCAKDVTYDNIAFKYGGAHGIGAGTVEGLTVRYCEFGWIGGSWFRTDILSRYGNAIEIYGGCRNYICDHNYIYQIYDAGITHQCKNPKGDILMCDIKYNCNLVEDTTYSIEYFLTFADPNALEEGEALGKRYMKNVEMCGNILRRSGYGFGDQRPDKSRAAHIKGWNHDNPAMNYTIHDNIFDTSKYMLLHIGAAHHKYLPKLWNNTYVSGSDEKASFGEYGDFTKDADERIYKMINYDESFEKDIEELVCEDGSIFVIEK